MVEISLLLPLQAVRAVESPLLLAVVRAASPPQLLLVDRVAVSPSLLYLEATVVSSLLLLAGRVVTSLSRLVRVVRVEVRDKKDRVAVKEAERARADMEVVSKVTAGEATVTMARAKVQASSRALRAVAPRLTLAPSPHLRRAQSKRWIRSSSTDVVTWYKRHTGMSAGCLVEMANHSFGLHDPFIDLNVAVLAARLLAELLYDFNSLFDSSMHTALHMFSLNSILRNCCCPRFVLPVITGRQQA